MLLDGVFVPVPTPFYGDGRLYLKKLEHNVERYSRTPVAGLVVLGPLAEADSLNDEERRQVLSAAAKTAALEKVLIAGVSRESVRETVELSRFAAEANYDAALVGTPLTLSQRVGNEHPELLAYFRGVADVSPLPVVIWDRIPSYPLPINVIAALAKHPNIIGVVGGGVEDVRSATSEIKREVTVTTTFTAATRRMLAPAEDAASGATFIQADLLGSGAAIAVAPPKPALKTRTKEVGFQILTSTTPGMIAGFEQGATGSIPGLAASAPQACFEVWAAWKDRDPALIEVKQGRVAAVAELFAELGVAGSKYGCDLNGYFGGFPRLPLLPLQEVDRRRVEDALREMTS